MFEIYFTEGVKHITDLQGYDHIAFLIALLAGYTFNDWKKVLILVTAFTVGHSITLALSALGVLNIDSGIIEFLIPVTIFLTAIYHLFYKPKSESNTVLYALALGFGFIHGAGFSNYFKSLMGKAASVFQPLLAFNLGVEVGQLVIVAFILGISYVLVQLFKLKQSFLQTALATIALFISIQLMIKTWPF